MKTKILHAALFTPNANGSWGQPLLIEDEPGVGKTAIIEQYAARFGLPVRVLSPGTDGEGAFGCIPVPKNDVLTYPPPDWTAWMADGGVVFLDEVTTAPPIIQASMMGMLTARRIGAHKFGPRVRILGACNPVSLAANGYDLAAPLANRFGHVKWGAPSVEEHIAYMLGGGQGPEDPEDAKAEEARVMNLWPEAYALAVGLESGFLQSQPDWKNKCPKGNNPKAGRAWPSDRTWELATRALAASKVHDLSESERDTLLQAYVGVEAATAFSTYMESADLPNIAELLDGKATFPANAPMDKAAVVMNAGTALVANKQCPNRAARAEALWKLLGAQGTGRLDIVAAPVTALINEGLHASKAAVPVLAKVQPLLAARKAVV